MAPLQIIGTRRILKNFAFILIATRSLAMQSIRGETEPLHHSKLTIA